MNPSTSAWKRLTAAARQAPRVGDVAAPYGFATRILALALAAEHPTLLSSINRFSWRALGFSLLMMLVSIVTNYSSVTITAEKEQELFDPVAEILTLS